MTADERASRIRTMFGRIARRYDLMNRLMTVGRDRKWRRIAAAELQLPPNGLCLDLATGTGHLAFAVRDAYPAARLVAVDFSLEMMRLGQEKARARGDPRIRFAQGDALRLPFADGQFDGLINGFLLRNLVELSAGLAEMRRVVKPGGRVVCLEITHPQTPIFREAFQLYFYRFVPVMGGFIAGDLGAYSYLPNSLTRFPPAAPLRDIMLEVGFREVRYRLRGMGTIAIHVAIP